MFYKTTSELKASAREKLQGNYGITAAALIVLEVLLIIVNNIIMSVADMNSTFGVITYSAISFIVNLITSILVVGALSMYMKIACNKKTGLGDLFSMFKQHPDKIILVELLIFVRMIVAFLPAIIAAVFFTIAGTESDIAYVILFLCLIVSVVACIYIRIITSQSYYLLIDFPQYSAKEIITFSKNIIKGHVWHYIGIVISFIPLMLLVVLSAGIGILFVYPYYQMTLTEFYLDIIREPASEKVNFSVTV